MGELTAQIRRATVADVPELTAFAAGVFHDTFAHNNDPAALAAYMADAYSPAFFAADVTDPGVRVDLLHVIEPECAPAPGDVAGPSGAGRSGATREPATQSHALRQSLAGYVRLVPGATQPCVALRRPVQISRFYVGPAFHGRGVAVRLMEHCVAVARSLEADGLWLGVWEHNPRARAFYRKHGFVEVGVMPFQFGPEMQEDLVMQRPLGG